MTDKVIPFYGSRDRSAFAIERAAMDRSGVVLDRLNDLLPANGTMLDVGAGNGYTAKLVGTPERTVVALEPAQGMIDPTSDIEWVQGVAQDLPFETGSFDGFYSTWAYFFPSLHDISAGLAEAHRVVRPGGQIIIVDNAGGDEFSSIAGSDLGTDIGFWRDAGFDASILETSFSFESEEDAHRLLTLYFGPATDVVLEIGYRVAVMTTTVGN